MAIARRDTALQQVCRLLDEGTAAGLPDARLLERYIASRDETAFEALVRRHGPMVLGVCRRILDDPNDADDAFQAAFLLLARDGRSIRADGSVGGWLHRVAWRIAVQVKSDAARRRLQERRAAERAGEPIAPGPANEDTAAVIHQEIDRLPDRYRRPVVLCYLEDMTYQQAADQLRWSEATTRGRLARARDLLRARLTRRGVTLAVAGLGIASPVKAAAVPTALLRATVRAARQLGLGEAAAAVSSTTIVLMRRAARTMMIARLKTIAAAAIVVATLAGLATGLAASGTVGDDKRPSGSRPIAKVDPASRIVAGRPEVGEGEMIAFRGRVLATDGKPAAGAGLYTVAPRPGEDSAEPILRARAARDGTFRFAITREAFDEATGEEPGSTITVLASTEGLGPDWVDLHRPPDEELVFRLVDDSVPIAGRILDLQGRPVAGAKVRRGRINAEGAEGIDPYLKRLRDEPGQATNHRFARSYDADYALPGRPSSITTDAEGRFRLDGIGRDRIVEIALEGPTIQGATITAMTRDAAPVSMPKDAFMARTIYGARFDHLIGPGRALTGVVRDKRTGQPLAGVKVAGREAGAGTTTDAEGRYTLPGFPKAESYELTVLAGHRPPYFVTCRVVSDTAGLDPLRADVDCVPGIPMRLKLIDKETGRPPRRAEVSYWPLHPNPHTREVPGFAAIDAIGPYNKGIAQADGTYLLGVLPGPGAVFVRTDEGKYRAPCVDPAAFFKDELKGAARRGNPHLFGDRNTLIVAAGDAYTGRPQETNGAIVLVNPPDGSGPIAAEAVLERDRKREIRVLGPDGRPLEGVTCQDKGAEATRTPGVMTVSRLNPMRPRRFTFRHDGRKLVGFLLARGDEPEPYALRLAPWGTIAGRLLDAQGQPRPGAIMSTIDWQERHDDPAIGLLSRVKTDAEGRFRVEGLVPGQSYTANAVGEEAEKRGFGVVIDRVVLEPGETRDLGDVRARTAASKGDD